MASFPPAPPHVRLRRLHDHALLPAYQSPGAAGMDLAAVLDAPLSLAPGDIALISTGWALEIPDHFEGQVRPRSGLSTRHGVTVPNAPGTIDSDYRGELKVALINLGREPFVVTTGMRIAQLVIAPVVRAHISEAEALPVTTRGAGGFGSTG